MREVSPRIRALPEAMAKTKRPQPNLKWHSASPVPMQAGILGYRKRLGTDEALKSAVESSQSAVKGNQIGYKLGIHMNINVPSIPVLQLYTASEIC